MKNAIKKSLAVSFVLLGVNMFGADCSNPATTADMYECENISFAKADKELNAVYKKLIAKQDSIGKAKLQKAQRAWMTLRDADAEFFADSARGGSMEGLAIIGTKATMTKERVKRLSAELN